MEDSTQSEDLERAHTYVFPYTSGESLSNDNHIVLVNSLCFRSSKPVSHSKWGNLCWELRKVRRLGTEHSSVAKHLQRMDKALDSVPRIQTSR